MLLVMIVGAVALIAELGMDDIVHDDGDIGHADIPETLDSMTNRVLAAAALRGKVDRLRGLKENVILGKLIPSQGMPRPAPMLIGGDEQREEEPVGTLSE